MQIMQSQDELAEYYLWYITNISDEQETTLKLEVRSAENIAICMIAV